MEEYGTANNRLMWYETNDISGQSTTPLSAAWYYYNDSGNVTRIVTENADSDDFSATLFSYAKNGSTVSFVVGETWTNDGGGIEDYEITYAREFRYDGARARYLNRELDPAELEQGNYVIASDAWTDYDGDSPYGDFTVDTSGNANNKMSYVPGVAQFAWMEDSGTSVPDGDSLAYVHSDLIGTARYQVDPTGAQMDPAVYTAFGELVDGPNHRYGYAGAWGYQARDDFPYLHVGARYYDPASGRFLQRDPIGLEGGFNSYEYALNRPTAFLDPYGLATTLNPVSLAEAGFTPAEIAGIIGCAAFAATKSWEEWKKHTDAVEAGRDMVRRLKARRKTLKKKRYKDAADKAIREETEKIKGHEKEIEQKWPDGEPAKPAG